MKKYKLLFLALIIILLSSCGEDTNTAKTRETTQTSNFITDIAKELEQEETTSKNEEITETPSLIPESEPKLEQESNDLAKSDESDIDIDLTKLNDLILKTKLTDMLYDPDKYLGQTVKMTGKFDVYYDDRTEENYFFAMVEDNTGCCISALEFVLDGDYVYPDDYPPLDTEITITGTFGYYMEGPFTYTNLAQATMEY